jgi:hypothetical protein
MTYPLFQSKGFRLSRATLLFCRREAPSCGGVIGRSGTSRVYLCNSLRYSGEEFAIKRVSRSEADAGDPVSVQHLEPLHHQPVRVLRGRSVLLARA